MKFNWVTSSVKERRNKLGLENVKYVTMDSTSSAFLHNMNVVTMCEYKVCVMASYKVLYVSGI